MGKVSFPLVQVIVLDQNMDVKCAGIYVNKIQYNFLRVNAGGSIISNIISTSFLWSRKSPLLNILHD
jgi:hypothetical protein